MNYLSYYYINFPLTFYIFVGILGAIIGSFLSVCIYRIPYGRPKGPPTFEEMNDVEGDSDNEQKAVQQPEQPQESLGISNPPRSFCPNCKNQLLCWHNIPILSWLLLKGRCYFCKAPVSFRYPLVEFLSAAAAISSVYFFGASLTALLIYFYIATLIVISFVDIDYYIIPDVISFPGIAIGFTLAVINHFSLLLNWPFCQTVWSSLIGLGFGGGVLLFISEVYLRLRGRVGLGLGDVKLLAMTGAFFGIEGAFCTMFYGSLIGSVLGISIMLFNRKGLSHHLPFGPYLALGTVIYVFTDKSWLFQF